MYIVTTLTYDQFGELIRNKRVRLDNENLVFGQNYEAVHQYIVEHLGTPGYVIGIKGRINKYSAELLSILDGGLFGNKIILETDVNEDDMLIFSVDKLSVALDILQYGLPDESVYNQLERSRDIINDGFKKRGHVLLFII